MLSNHVSLDKRSNKQSGCRWNKTPMRRHSNVTIWTVAKHWIIHYNYVIMGTTESQPQPHVCLLNRLLDQIKHLSSASLAFARGIHRGPWTNFSLTMMTSSNGNIFRVTGPLCGEFTGHRWIPRTKASDAELLWFLWSAHEKTVELKKWWGWWFETPSRPLWRRCNETSIFEPMLVHPN